MDKPFTLDLQTFLPFRLNRLAAEISGALERIYGERFGIDIPEWRVLATLGAHAPVTAQFVVRSTRTHKTRISRAIAHLVERGLVERVPAPDDRREMLLRMTMAGEALYAELVPVVLEEERKFLSALPPSAEAALLAALDILETAHGLREAPPRLRGG